jgi:3,4-dihydroxy 2-butanone 4-phosphate synthase/GTP cyclohydrolase II
MSEFFAS